MGTLWTQKFFFAAFWSRERKAPAKFTFVQRSRMPSGKQSVKGGLTCFSKKNYTKEKKTVSRPPPLSFPEEDYKTDNRCSLLFSYPSPSSPQSFKKSSRILLSRVLNGVRGGGGYRTTVGGGGSGGRGGGGGRGRHHRSFEISPSSFRYYSSSVEYLTGD